MTNMVDRVAREILAAHDFTKNDGAEGGWDTLAPDWQECFRAMARAAIKALREPTFTMLYEGEGLCDFVMPDGFENTREARQAELRCGWQAMIDAALTHPE